jgi:copper(I)-binding protein
MLQSLAKFPLLMLLLFAAQSASAAGSVIQVQDPWIREAPPGMPMLAAFMVIHNSGDRPVAVTAVHSPQFGRIEMHRTVVSNGVARMLAQPRLVIPAGGSLTLKPGGYHLMLFGAKSRLTAGQHAQLTLELDHGAPVTVTAEVRRSAGMGGMMMHHNH